MILGVRVINPNGEDILMRLNGSEQGPFSLWSIEGLDQGEAEINVDEISTVDGSIFNSARQSSRELTITAILNDSVGPYAIQNAREQCYKYFPLKQKITVIFYLDDINGGMKSYITEGYVKSNPVDIFAKKCAMRVTIVRTKPCFYENYSSGDYFNIYDTVGISASNIHINDKKYFTDFANHSYEFRYSNVPGIWDMYIDGDTSSPEMVDIYDDLGIIITGSVPLDSVFKLKANPYINFKIREEQFIHFAIDEGSILLCPSESYIENEGAETGFLVSFKFTEDILVSDLSNDIYNHYKIFLVSNPIFTNRGDNPPSYSSDYEAAIKLNLSYLINYPDFEARGIKKGDMLIINTSVFQKDIRLYLSDELREISCLGIIDFEDILKNTKWPKINFGKNQIALYSIYAAPASDPYHVPSYFSDQSGYLSSNILKWTKQVRGI